MKTLHSAALVALLLAGAALVAVGCGADEAGADDNTGGSDESSQANKPEPFAIAELPELEEEYHLTPAQLDTTILEENTPYIVHGRVQAAVDGMYAIVLTDCGDAAVGIEDCPEPG